MVFWCYAQKSAVLKILLRKRTDNFNIIFLFFFFWYDCAKLSTRIIIIIIKCNRTFYLFIIWHTAENIILYRSKEVCRSVFDFVANGYVYTLFSFVYYTPSKSLFIYMPYTSYTELYFKNSLFFKQDNYYYYYAK